MYGRRRKTRRYAPVKMKARNPKLQPVIEPVRAEATEPEYPDRTAAAEVEAVLWKLNQSWETFYNPMPEAEAEKTLRDCFPGYGSGIKTRSRLRD